MKHIGLVISDIHVGAFNPAKLYEEFHEIFINYIIELTRSNLSLDFLIITGDYFDHKFFLNDKESSYAYMMLNELFSICKSMNTKIRIVYGTESHENDQYNVLNVINLYPDIKVIKHVEYENLFDDLKVLYIPEEYIYDKNEYYKEYFENKEYDYIFGHGIVQEVMKDAVSHMRATNQKRLKPPVFTSRELENICKGQVFFGHYHIRTIIHDKIISVGSFSRWKFGEDGSKGFYRIDVDSEENLYDYEFIENTLAESYKTIGFGYNSKVYNDNDSMKKELDKIDNLLDKDVIDHIRFEFSIPSDVENPESTINYIKERYKFNKKVKVDITHGYIAEKKEKEKEIIKEENQKYDFINDENLSIEDQVRMYIGIEYNAEIPKDRIDLYMNKDVNDILSNID